MLEFEEVKKFKPDVDEGLDLLKKKEKKTMIEPIK